MQILSCDAQDRSESVADAGKRKSVRYLAMWFFGEQAWDMGDYGEYDTAAYHGVPYGYLGHYVEMLYAEGSASSYGSYTLDELNALVKDKFGITLSADAPYVQQNTDEDGKIRLYAGIAGFAFVYDIVDLVTKGDVDIITVQHYNEVNRLIKSVKVAYRVGTDGRIYGCELLEDAKYAPFGMLGTAYKYKGWQPMK